MITELKPDGCPCCGSASTLTVGFPPLDDCAFVTCDGCGLSTKIVATAAEAVAAWNRRPDPAPLAPLVLVEQQASLHPGQQSNMEAALARLTREMQSFDMVPRSMPTCGGCRKPVPDCICFQTNDGPDQPDAAPDNSNEKGSP